MAALVNDVQEQPLARTRVRSVGKILWRLTNAALVCYAIGVLVLCYTPVTDWLLRPLTVPSSTQQTDAIVLLAAWASPDGLLNEAGMRRTIEATHLYKRGIAPTIIVSGRNRSAGSGPTAQVMANLAMELGVPASAIILETNSQTTHQSAVNVAHLARSRGWSRVTLISDAKDMRRALASFRHEALEAHPGADIRWDRRSAMGPVRLSIFANTVHEWVGLAYYRWKGWV
jgi:uncharacterized SAM-binding protein YcdF (DUF218 family)